MKTAATFLGAMLATAVAGCGYPHTPPALAPITTPAPGMAAAAAPTSDVRAPVTILVSIDGFRPDYLDRGVTPTLNRLRAEGKAYVVHDGDVMHFLHS